MKLARLTAAVTPRRILATAFTLGTLTGIVAPVVATVTATAGPAASVAMYYDGPGAGPNMYYD